MPAAVLFIGISTFISCLGAHVLLWRFRRPQRQLPTLLVFFFIAGPLIIFGSRIFFNALYDSPTGTDWLAAVLLHFALSCGYIQLYPASQAESPSVTVLIAVQRSMPRGMSEAEIRSLLAPQKTFGDRVEDLMISGLVTEKNGKLSLTGRGRAFILPFIYYRRMLGIPEGKG